MRDYPFREICLVPADSPVLIAIPYSFLASALFVLFVTVAEDELFHGLAFEPAERVEVSVDEVEGA